METLAEKDPYQRGLLTLWIIWAAVVASLLAYVFIGILFGEEIRHTESTDLPVAVIRNLLYVVMAVILFLTHFLRKLMLSGKFSNTVGESFETGAGSNQPSFMGQYTIVTVVSLALFESIGIFGFVLFLLGGSIQTLYIFVGISALAMYFYRPKREEIERLASAMRSQGASSSEL